MLGGLAAYLLNFLAGKNKNSKLAHSWLAAHKQLLEDNFSVIGLKSTLCLMSLVLCLLLFYDRFCFSDIFIDGYRIFMLLLPSM